MQTEKPDYKIEYPELSEQGKKTTQVIIDRFGEELKEMMNKTIVSFTNNLSEEIVSDDSWISVRQKTLEALCGYSESERVNKAGGTYLGQWWTKIRKQIWEENKDAIIEDIFADKDLEIKRLKERISDLNRERVNF